MKPIVQFSDEELLKRLKYLAGNIYYANGVLCIPENSGISSSYHSTLEEIKKRSLLSEEDAFVSWSKLTDKGPIIHSNKLVRYSKNNWLNKLKEGTVSFGPTEVYEKCENEAQCDCETSRFWHVPDQVVTIAGVEYKVRDITYEQPINIVNQGPLHPYHLLCLSEAEVAMAQRAFSAEGYVIIEDRKVFFETISAAIDEKFGGKTYRGLKPVQYYDDIEAPKYGNVFDLWFHKPLRFFYQREIRFLLDVEKPITAHIDIQVSWPKGLISEIRSFD